MLSGGWKLKLVYTNVTFLDFCVWSADCPFLDKGRSPEQYPLRIPDHSCCSLGMNYKSTVTLHIQLHLSACGPQGLLWRVSESLFGWEAGRGGIVPGALNHCVFWNLGAELQGTMSQCTLRIGPVVNQASSLRQLCEWHRVSLLPWWFSSWITVSNWWVSGSLSINGFPALPSTS